LNRVDDPASALGACRGRILVADDDEMIRKLFRDVLQSAGHEVILAEDGQQALEKVLTARPDVILLDVMMPKLNGFEVCRRLKADPATASIPILLVTGMGEREKRIEGVAAGADDFLLKPVDYDELVLRVRNAAYRKQLYDELADKYAELKAMAEVRDSLTQLIDVDTEMLASQMDPQAQVARAAESIPAGTGQVPQKGGEHGAD